MKQVVFKLFSIIFYILAVLSLLVGLYITSLGVIIPTLIGESNMGPVIDSIKSQLPIIGNSLLFSGIFFIILGVIFIFIGILIWKKQKSKV